MLQPLSQTLMPQIRKLREQLIPSGTDRGDAISALVIAIQMISQHCKKLKYKRRIVLITNGEGGMDPHSLQGIVGKIKEDGIEIIVL